MRALFLKHSERARNQKSGWLCNAICWAVKDKQSVSPKMQREKADPLSFARDMVALKRPLRLRGRWSPPKDGLYRVSTGRKVHGGFLVLRRRVVRASPYVRRYIHIFAIRNAEWVCLV